MLIVRIGSKGASNTRKMSNIDKILNFFFDLDGSIFFFFFLTPSVRYFFFYACLRTIFFFDLHHAPPVD